MKTTKAKNEAREPSYIHQALKINRRARLRTPYAKNEKWAKWVRARTCYDVKKTVMHTESDYEKCVQVIMYVYEHMYDER